MSARLEHYEQLHDALSDMIEGGRLTPERIPADDYLTLVRLLTTVPVEPANQWTVLLCRPDYIADDNLDTFMTYVEAETAKQAIRKAQGEAIVQDYADDEETRFADLREFAEYHDREDYACLLCIKGDHQDQTP